MKKKNISEFALIINIACENSEFEFLLQNNTVPL